MRSFLEELCLWLNENRLNRKVLFSKSLTTGNQLLRMAAAHGTPAINVQACPVLAYMSEQARPKLSHRGLQRIDRITASMALRDCMDKFQDAFSTLGEVELTTAESVLPLLFEFAPV